MDRHRPDDRDRHGRRGGGGGSRLDTRRSRSPERRHRHVSRSRSPHGRGDGRYSRSPRRDRERKHGSRSRSRSPRRVRGYGGSRSRSPTRKRGRSRSRSGSPRRRRHGRGSHSRSRSQESDGKRHKRRHRSRSASRSSSSGSSDEEEKRRRKERKKEKKERKREKRERKKKKGAASGAQWGKYGIISETDLYNKSPEFHAWLVEERMINPETLSKDQSRKEFAKFVEDYNTATLPQEKYYSIAAFDARMAAVRYGELLPPTDDGYDAFADLRALEKEKRRLAGPRETYLSREQLEELRQVERERVQAGKMKVLGMEVGQNMGVRMDGTSFE